MIFLLVEFLDELVFGLTEAAWPLLRSDLGLSYLQIGLALSLPGLISNMVEPFLFILGDAWSRRILILTGGLCFIASLALTALSRSFTVLLLSFLLFNPASGAFVGLSQATLMDSSPARHERDMASWTLAGSLGVLLGPLLLGGLVAQGLGWRSAFWALAILAAATWLGAFRFLPRPSQGKGDFPTVRIYLESLRSAFAALKDWNILRWLILLEFSDLLLDVFHGFLAIYLVDVMKLTVPQAAFVLAAYSGLGLLGNLVLIPLLGRLRGLDYLRGSAGFVLVAFPVFLIVSAIAIKLLLLGLLGISVAGWYSILKANQFLSLPGRSGTAQALNNVSGLFGKLIPLGVGAAAQSLGLPAAMWLLMAGPVALLLGLPRRRLTPST